MRRAVTDKTQVPWRNHLTAKPASYYKQLMKWYVLAVVAAGFLTGCNLFEKPNRIDNGETASTGEGRTEKRPEIKLQSAKSEFTGKVVLVGEGYRFRPLDSEDVFRLTKAKRSREFEHEEMILRKYYEKTLVVRGTREGDWIWEAEVIGQWLRPGERRGSNVLAPPVNNQ
jgi:hypothetical protein